MKIEWTYSAIEDRNNIFDYIEQYNPQAAVDIDKRLADQIAILSIHPNAGRSGRVESTRELVINNTNLIVVYKALYRTVLILRILHSSQIWPSEEELKS